MIIESSGVTKYGTLVNSLGEVLTNSVIKTRAQEATDRGDSLNIVTSEIALTSTNESGLFYFQNNDTRAYFIDAFIIVSEAIASGTTVNAGSNRAYVYKNPTGFGTTTNCDIVQNRNTARPSSLGTSLAYEGVEGTTITNGDLWARFFFGDGVRINAVLDFEIAKGDSVAVSVKPKVTAGAQDFYVVMVGHFKSGAVV